MTKRKLNSKYKDLVDYVENNKNSKHLIDLISSLLNQAKIESKIANDFFDGKSFGTTIDNLIPIISDIYFNNYELGETKYYWIFELPSAYGISLRAFKYESTKKIGLLNVEVETAVSSQGKFTKSELNSFLKDAHLTADNFKPIENLN